MKNIKNGLTIPPVLLFSVLLLLSFWPTTATIVTDTNQQPVPAPFDPWKAVYPDNFAQILAEKNINNANLRLPKIAPNGTLLNADLLNQPSTLRKTESNLDLLLEEHHLAWGTFLEYEEHWYTGEPMIMGLEVMVYVDTDLTLPQGCVLYAPSSRAPDPNAFEVSTIYSNESGTMSRSVGAWDWSIPDNDHFNWLRTFAWFDANSYFGTYQGRTYYSLVLYEWPEDEYSLFLWDFTAQDWEWQTVSDGPREVDGSGQVYYEYIYWDEGPLIPSNIPILQASNIMIYWHYGQSSPDYMWELNYDYLGLSSGDAWGNGEWLADQDIPFDWWDDKYFYDWYVGS